MMDLSENSSLTTISPLFQHCINILIASWWIKVILLLPLSTIILYLGLQKWRQHRSFQTASHFDVFTYNLAAIKFFCTLAYLCQICAIYCNFTALDTLTSFINSAAFFGEVFFHMLTCVDRFVAVVHHVLYLRMGSSCGVRIRTVSISCVWLLSFGMAGCSLDQSNTSGMLLLCLLGFVTVIMCFFSLSVLCALIRPGPGEKGLVDRSKRRALRTITTISGAQWLWFFGILAVFALETPQLAPAVACVVGMSLDFLNVPSCLTLPLLYLHKTGRLSHN